MLERVGANVHVEVKFIGDSREFQETTQLAAQGSDKYLILARV